MKILIISSENIKTARRIADGVCDHIDKASGVTKYIRLTNPVNTVEDLDEELLDDIKESYRIDDFDYFIIPAKSFIPDAAGSQFEKALIKNVDNGAVTIAYLTEKPVLASAHIVKSSVPRANIAVFMQPATHGEEKRITKEIFENVY